MNTRIFCLGNELVCDDGVAIRVGRILASLSLPPEVQVEFAPQLGFDLLDVVQGAERIVLVDAMSTGRPPGTCVALEGTAIARYSAGAAISHTVGIAELIEVAHRLAPGRSRPSILFVGIEGQCFDRYGRDLSPKVRAAIPEAVDEVLRSIGASEALLAEGRAASLRYLDPALKDILLGESDQHRS
jgi:hydrogenase maturation protease